MSRIIIYLNVLSVTIFLQKYRDKLVLIPMYGLILFQDIGWSSVLGRDVARFGNYTELRQSLFSG